MSKQSGRNLSLSPFRSLVVDLMHFCQKVPGQTVERPMKLGRQQAPQFHGAFHRLAGHLLTKVHEVHDQAAEWG